MRYLFIRAHRDEFDIRTMCRVLEVSRGGYYASRSWLPSQREQDNQALVEQIKQVHRDSRQTYGSPVHQPRLSGSAGQASHRGKHER